MTNLYKGDKMSKNDAFSHLALDLKIKQKNEVLLYYKQTLIKEYAVIFGGGGGGGWWSH